MNLIIKSHFIFHLIRIPIIVYRLLNFFIYRLNFYFIRLNYLFLALITIINNHLNHSNFLYRQKLFYIFPFLTIPFEFNL